VETPRREPERPPRAVDEKVRQAGTILVIDDDAAARDLMQRFLTREGFHAETTENGEDGIRLARELKPNVVTLDVMMPKMDGWAVLQALKADPALRSIPVIMMTIVDDRNLGYTLGASEYMTKPIDRDQLSGILSKYRCLSPPCPVLLIEDDENTRSMIRRMLRREGWAVTEAANGQEGLEAVASNRPTVILLDLMMPKMDGFDFITELHRHPEWRNIPIVVLTARDLSADDRRRLSGYVEKILSKGAVSREELLGKVRELVTACVPNNC
jgi:CheY-like chemotaxis protein